jgi:hypothetical protein
MFFHCLKERHSGPIPYVFANPQRFIYCYFAVIFFSVSVPIGNIFFQSQTYGFVSGLVSISPSTHFLWRATENRLKVIEILEGQETFDESVMKKYRLENIFVSSMVVEFVDHLYMKKTTQENFRKIASLDASMHNQLDHMLKQAEHKAMTLRWSENSSSVISGMAPLSLLPVNSFENSVVSGMELVHAIKTVYGIHRGIEELIQEIEVRMGHLPTYEQQEFQMRIDHLRAELASTRSGRLVKNFRQTWIAKAF